MREYGQIQTSFWTSPDVQSLSDQARLLAAYLLTGPHSNGLGCYRLPDGYVMEDFGWGKETVSIGFEELFQKGFSSRCDTTNFVLIHKFLKWNPIANGNVAKAREKEFATIPEISSIHKELCKAILKYGDHLPNSFETLLKGYTKQDPTQPNPTQTLSKSTAEGVSDTQKHPPAWQELRAELAALNFTHEQVHTAKVMGLVKAWAEAGLARSDLREIVQTLRERSSEKSFGPAYLDGPVADYLEAKKNGNTAGGKEFAEKDYTDGATDGCFADGGVLGG